MTELIPYDVFPFERDRVSVASKGTVAGSSASLKVTLNVSPAEVGVEALTAPFLFVVARFELDVNGRLVS